MQSADTQLTAFFFVRPACFRTNRWKPSARPTAGQRIFRNPGFTRGYFDYADGVSSLGVFIKIGFECVFKIDFRRQTELAPEPPAGLLH